ncbi:hypothetical protein DAI22_10g100100 [Oryza sativa Japonica Group]|nr:hypothetical protein DAI22_10g100100 [Oryza sativa Japonica Group]
MGRLGLGGPRPGGRGRAEPGLRARATLTGRCLTRSSWAGGPGWRPRWHGRERGEEPGRRSDGSRRAAESGERWQSGASGGHRKREGVTEVPSTGSDMGERRDGGRRRRPCGGGMGGMAREQKRRPAAELAVWGGSLELKVGGGEGIRHGTDRRRRATAHGGGGSKAPARARFGGRTHKLPCPSAV